MALGMELVEVNVAFLPVERVHRLHWEGHQSKREVAAPTCSKLRGLKSTVSATLAAKTLSREGLSMLREPIQPGCADWVEVDRFNVKVRAQRETSAPGWWQCVTIPIGTRIVLEAAS